MMNLLPPIKGAIQKLAPSYFALVMSTGIVSIASHLLQYDTISYLLFWLNNIEYVVLIVLLILRCIFFFANIKDDISAPAKGAGFLSFVAAPGILGVQYTLLKQNFTAGVLFWSIALVAWLVLIYSFLILMIISKRKPSLEEGINGGWLLLVVATQSLSILGALIAPYLPFAITATLFFTLSAYLVGFLLYIIMITIIIYRLLFFTLEAEEFVPSYWINMGAAAISTLAGATLITSMAAAPLYQSFVPTLKMLSLLTWATSTWWIPVIVILEGWRLRQILLKYNPGYWSMVFPMGMYTVATWRLAEVLPAPFLQPVARAFLYIAWVVWLITFLAMCFNVIQLFLPGISKKKTIIG